MKQPVSNGVPTILLVLGMHRSGTSTFARSTRILGANLGEKLIGNREDNPKGFFEDGDLGRLHVEMEEALDAPWDRLTLLTTDEIAKLVELGFADRAEKLLRQKTESGGLHAFKFPPMAKFHPFWSTVFRRGGFDDVRRLLAIRHPLSVARSLRRRDGLEEEYACLLLLAHLLPALPGLCSGLSVVADYDALVENPDEEIRRIGKCLQLEVSPAAMAEFSGQFLSRDLRHSTHSLADLAGRTDIDPLVLEVYRDLLDFARDHRSLSDEPTSGLFATWNRAYEAKRPLLASIERVTAERDRLAILLDNAEKELAWRNQSLSWRLTRPLRDLRTLFSKPAATK